jgi:hypothetical protein
VYYSKWKSSVLAGFHQTQAVTNNRGTCVTVSPYQLASPTGDNYTNRTSLFGFVSLEMLDIFEVARKNFSTAPVTIHHNHQE